jgi:hypothetical protein
MVYRHIGLWSAGREPYLTLNIKGISPLLVWFLGFAEGEPERASARARYSLSVSTFGTGIGGAVSIRSRTLRIPQPCAYVPSVGRLGI